MIAGLSQPPHRTVRVYIHYLCFFLSQNIILDYNNNDTSVIYYCYLLCENREEKNSSGYNMYSMYFFFEFRVLQSKLDMRPQKGLSRNVKAPNNTRASSVCTYNMYRCSKDVIYMVLSFCRYYNYSASALRMDESNPMIFFFFNNKFYYF